MCYMTNEVEQCGLMYSTVNVVMKLHTFTLNMVTQLQVIQPGIELYHISYSKSTLDLKHITFSLSNFTSLPCI